MIVSFVQVIPDWRDKNFWLLNRYQRQGNNLIYTHTLTLLQAISCEPIFITTLDGRVLTVGLDEIVTQNSLKVVEGEGMPIERDDKRKNELKE